MHSGTFRECCTKTILLTLLLLALSSRGRGVASKKDLVSYVRHHPSSSTQKPRICQIYSRSTKKHVQIFSKKITATGSHGDPYSKVEKTSFTFGVVTIRGIKSKRYMCLSRRGKLVAKKKLTSDGSCLFVENITAAFWTSFRSNKHENWYVGFNHKNGRPKKGRKTGAYQEACNFLVRDHEAAEPEVDTFPEYIREAVRNLQEKIRRKHGLSRRRRHRFQTEDPIDGDTSDLVESLRSWMKQLPADASPEAQKEWMVHVQSILDNFQPRSPQNPTLSTSDLDLEPPSTSKLGKIGDRGGGRNDKTRPQKRPRRGRERRSRKLKAAAAAGNHPEPPLSRREIISEAVASKIPLQHTNRGKEQSMSQSVAAFPPFSKSTVSDETNGVLSTSDSIAITNDSSYGQSKTKANIMSNGSKARTTTPTLAHENTKGHRGT